MSAVAWIVVQPRVAATGAPVTVRLAGGGRNQPYRHPVTGEQHRAGVANLPRFQASLDFGQDGWTGGTTPQTGKLRFAPAETTLLALLSSYYWPEAALTVEIGQEGAAPTLLLTGTVASITADDGAIEIEIADLSNALDKPLLTGRFAGTGGIEGGAEAAGRVKRRSWGRVFNVEGLVLDKTTNVYEFGDPEQRLGGFTALRDMGREGPFATLAWQGSAAATLAALKASAPAQGGGVVAPSIACAKWWTQPVGPLTADLQGEVGAGYVETVPAIAARVAAAANGPAVSNVAAVAAIRSDPAGLHIANANETAAAALDRLLLGASLLWVLQPAGTIVLREWTFAAPVATLQARSSKRTKSFAPMKTRRVGYQRSNRLHSDGEIAAVLQIGDIDALAPIVDRVTAGLDEDGNVARPIPADVKDESHILSRPGGGTYQGALDATGPEAINPNSRFADYPVANLPPTSWGFNGSLNGGSIERVVGQAVPWAMRATSAPGFFHYISQLVGSPSQSSVSSQQYVMIEADIRLVSGVLHGAGFRFDSYSSSVDYAGGGTIVFSTAKDTSGVAPGPGAVGREYQFRKLVRLGAGAFYAFLSMDTANGNLGDISAARSIIWRRAGMRPATDMEIRTFGQEDGATNGGTVGENIRLPGVGVAPTSRLDNDQVRLVGGGDGSAYLIREISPGNVVNIDALYFPDLGVDASLIPESASRRWAAESAADLTKFVAGYPNRIDVQYDYLNNPKEGQLGRSFFVRLVTAAGTEITSGVAWAYLVKTGSVNGYTSASGWVAMAGTGAGTFPLDALGASEATVEFRGIYGGRSYYSPGTVPIKKLPDEPPTSSGGSGGGGGAGPATIASNNPSSNINSTSWKTVTGALQGQVPTGKTSATITVYLDVLAAQASPAGNWNVEAMVQRDVSGTWTQIGATANSDPDTSVINEGGNMYARDMDGVVSFSVTDSVAPGTYNWRVQARLSLGTKLVYITGSVVVTA